MDESKEIYKDKIELYNMVLQRLKNDERKFELVEEKDKDDILGELNTYIKCLFQFFWSHSQIVSNILSNSNIKDAKDYLAHFFANNFYENILSNNNKEEQLLYIITHLLKKEINNLNINNNNINNIENTFLNDTPCGYIFQELAYKKDIQSYFKMIIIDLIEQMESVYPSQEIVLDPGIIKENLLLTKLEEEKEKEDLNKDKKNDIFWSKKLEKDMEKKLELFDVKYKFGLPREELEKILENDDIKQNKNMIDYINKKISESSNNPYLYSTEILLENINFLKLNNVEFERYNDDIRKILSKNILTIYKQSYLEIINIIDKLLDNLISNLHLLPYSIKCINKIISILINKKYPNLSAFERNIFIAKFFFNKLFVQIFANPTISALINEFIISDNTIVNISKILPIINKFISGQFYKDNKEEGIYTPFNWFFLKKMPILLEFFEKSQNIKLPNYIEKIIDKDEDENENDYNYEFDYFEENEEKMVIIKNICFSYDEFYYLFKNMKKNKNKIFKNKNNKNKRMEKALEKLINNEEKIDNLKKEMESTPLDNINNDAKSIRKAYSLGKEINKKKTLKFFLISELVFNKKYSNLFNIKDKKEYFNLKELKEPKPDENNIIKAKNFICDLLYNFQSLNSINLDIDNKNKLNTLKILKELKKYLKSSDLLKDEKIPTQWYINSIIEYLKKISQNLIENDYSELFNQLEEDINKSIKLLNFEKISLFVEKIKLAKKSHIFYNKAKTIMIDIDLNQQAHSILEKEIIPAQIKFSYSEKEKKFEIYPHSGKENDFFKYFYSPKKKKCQTIKQFTNIFPDLMEYNKKQDLNVFDIMNELKVPEKLLKYFDYIGDHIKQLKIVNQKTFNDIKIKIYDYVMEKIYDKIFPNEPGKEDLQIFQNCDKCSWVELRHFVKGKNDYILENFLPDTIKNFEQINKEKSPRKKLMCVNKIFRCIFNLAQLNGDMIDGTDDSLPILNYAFIKANPFLIYSNCRFMKLFLGEKKNKADGHQLSQLIGICMQISEINSKSFFDVTEEEFNKNCFLASENTK